MSLEELVRTRRTIHQYTDEKIADELVKQALSLGLWAPNHKMTFPWRWTITSAESRQQLAELAIHLKSEKSQGMISEGAAKGLRDALTKPSHYIALSMVRSEDSERLWEDYASIACSVQIISLFLWENKVGSKWTTSGYSRHDQTYKILSIDPIKEKLVGGLLLGIPAHLPQPGRRPDLKDCLRFK